MEIVNDRAVGVWGLLRIFQEMMRGGWYSADLYYDPSEQARELRIRLETQIEQCLEESQQQCTSEELRRLSLIYMQRAEPVTRHAGFSFPTFVDFISCILIQVLDFLIIDEIAEDYLRSEIERVRGIDLDYVWAGVSNEMRLVEMWRKESQPNAAPPTAKSQSRPGRPPDPRVTTLCEHFAKCQQSNATVSYRAAADAWNSDPMHTDDQIKAKDIKSAVESRQKKKSSANIGD